MTSLLLEADQLLGYTVPPTYNHIFRSQDEEPVIALLEGGQRGRLGVFRAEELAAEGANGGSGRERAAIALTMGTCPATIVAAGIGGLVGGPVRAAIEAGVTASHLLKEWPPSRDMTSILETVTPTWKTLLTTGSSHLATNLLND
ncbi:hypothetical protein NW767_000039 [Fusarium falciforme]|nr:hypothetical protein NW767_000039 [Fusarium falciforme]